ncbi:hypothetical protein KC364_g38 [Hortaea werneckii]|nr:hypothetical protein KC364_g38 [Hortaea werneckii]
MESLSRKPSVTVPANRSCDPKACCMLNIPAGRLNRCETRINNINIRPIVLHSDMHQKALVISTPMNC